MQVQNVNTNNYNTNFTATLKLNGNKKAFTKPVQEFFQQRAASIGNPNDVIILNLSKPYTNSRKIAATAIFGGNLIDDRKNIGYMTKNKIEEHGISTFGAICNYLIGLSARTANLSQDGAEKKFFSEIFDTIHQQIESQYTNILKLIQNNKHSIQDDLMQLKMILNAVDIANKQNYAMLKEIKYAQLSLNDQAA